MQNRYLPVFLIIIAALLGLLGGCSTDTQERSTQPVPNDLRPTRQAVVQPPQVFELDVEKVFGWSHPEFSKERQTLRFQLAVGDRVEGEVTTNMSVLLSTVKDPYGNIIVESARWTNPVYEFRAIQKSTQKYPWQFAFTADTTGEFSLGVGTSVDTYDTPPTNAHVKVFVYKK